MFVPFVYKYLLTVIGTGDEAYHTFVDLDLPEVEGWGPHIDAITAHTLTEDRTTNIRWKIVFWWTVDGKKWEGPEDLFAETGSSNATVIQSDFNTKAKLGLKMKFALAGRSSSQSASIEKALVTCACAYSFRS